MFKRRKTALAVLAMAAAAVFVLPASSASAGTATVPNACANSVTANFSQISVTTSGDDGLTTVAPGGATTTSNLTQSAAIPGAIFVAGYNLGLLVVGPNNIPANVRSTIEATNTVEGQQLTNVAGGAPPNGSVTVSTTITDPDGTPGTGDETGTDASFSVTYTDLNWTAGGSGTIDYRQQSIAAWPATAANNSLLINAVVGGFLNVQFRCAPGTVTPPDPGTVALIDPAASFDTTLIEEPVVNTAPTANAGPDQTVNEGALVTLDGSGSTDPQNDPLTYSWTAPAGVTLTGANTASPTFTAPQVDADTPLTFTLEVCDTEPLCDTDTVVITVLDVPPAVIDATGVVIVNGPVSSRKTSKSFVFKVTNVGMTPITLDFATDITGSVTVNGAETGTVTPNAGTKTLNPGASTRVKLVWSYAAGDLATGDTVVFSACVNAAGDIDTSNDCDDETATAK